LSAMRAAGAEIIELKEVAPEKGFEKCEGEVLFSEFKADLNAYLASLGPTSPVHSLADVIRFNQEHAEQVMPYFGQERMLRSQAKGSLQRRRYQEALARGRRQTRDLGLDAALQQNRLDAILAPTGGPAWLTDLVNGDHYTGGGFSSPAAVAGYPHITVPAGYIWGLPVGLSFVGGAWQEPVLIRLAYAFEQITRVRRSPQFLPTADLLKG
jgi:amidase